MLLPPSLGQLRGEARADVLADWLRERIDGDVEVAVAKTYEALAQAIVDAEVDLAWAPPLVCARVADRVPVIFKAIRGGRATYCAAIVTRKDGPKTLEELRGKRAAWIDRNSVGGYRLASAHLREHGVDPDRDLAASRFHGAYADALRAVLSGNADFAATFSAEADEAETRRRLQELVGPSADELAILGYTAPAPSDGLVLTGRSGRRLDELLAQLRPLVDGTEGHTFMLSLLEADRLVAAEPGDYAPLLA
jgi:phosphonate transport system substrate-binding protein